MYVCMYVCVRVRVRERMSACVIPTWCVIFLFLLYIYIQNTP